MWRWCHGVACVVKSELPYLCSSWKTFNTLGRRCIGCFWHPYFAHSCEIEPNLHFGFQKKLPKGVKAWPKLLGHLALVFAISKFNSWHQSFSFFLQVFTTWGKLYNPLQLKQELCEKKCIKIVRFQGIVFEIIIFR